MFQLLFAVVLASDLSNMFGEPRTISLASIEKAGCDVAGAYFERKCPRAIHVLVQMPAEARSAAGVPGETRRKFVRRAHALLVGEGTVSGGERRGLGTPRRLEFLACASGVRAKAFY